VISIVSLIYRSTKYADSVWQSAHEFTPHLKDGRAEFFFVANDATDEVKAHLLRNNYAHVVQENERLSDAELIKRGLAPPEYMSRVYRGYNRAIEESHQNVVLVNSDHRFSPGWLDALDRLSSPNRIVCSKTVERVHPKFGKFKYALEGDFGSDPASFQSEQFLKFCKISSMRYLEDGGAYGPCMFNRAVAIRAGKYPEGNLPNRRYGDVEFFARLAAIGVSHVTACDSLVYHFKEGEKEEAACSA
jgi:hypothetical protein